MTGQVAWKLFYNKDILIKCGLNITVDHNTVVRHKIDRGKVRNKQVMLILLALFASHKLKSYYNHLLKLRWNEWTHARQGPNLCARRGDFLEILSHLQIVEASLHLCRRNLLKQYFHVVDVSTFESPLSTFQIGMKVHGLTFMGWNEKSWCPTAMLQRTNTNMNISSWDAGKLMAPFSSGMESLGKDRHIIHVSIYKPCISVYFLIFYNIWFIKLCLDIRTTSKFRKQISAA